MLAPGDRNRRYNNWTFKARVEHDLTPRNLVYASISSGFSPSDVSITTNANYVPETLDLKAETLTAYEIGSKNRFLNDKLQLNLAAYYYDYDGYQTNNINVAPPFAPSAFTTFIVPVHVAGVEVETLVRRWRNGQFSLNGEYSKSRYHDIPQAAQPYFPFRTVPGVPPFRMNASYNHTVPLDDRTALILSGQMRVYSPYNTTRINVADVLNGDRPLTHLGWRAVDDLNATLSLDKGRFSLTGYVRNVADTRFKTRVVISDFAPGASSVTLSDPRTYDVVATAKF